ncbi:MAG: hypothetical protein MJK11_20295 [Pseudomonadales bacterium]|nr:hypothetical protein [Pseudomonadales bacterium]
MKRRSFLQSLATAPALASVPVSLMLQKLQHKAQAKLILYFSIHLMVVLHIIGIPRW